ncbi:histidinol-phosphate transaminase [Aspergillus wentii]|nr:histidinol-phosphate transaminase [Aspergillus wentii]
MSQRLQPSHFSLEFSIRPTLFHSPVIKVVILASPGNPTGSLIPVKHIKRILNLETFHGLLVVDEAYIDFSSTPEDASTVQLLSEYANLVVVQSLS